MNSATSQRKTETQLLFRAGDWVRVRDLDSIRSTLDTEARLNGLPFMPGMIPFCGRRFRIAKVADTICLDNAVHRLGACVVLQTSRRCDGESYRGCQFGCHFLWRNEWLEVANVDQSTVQRGQIDDGPAFTKLVQLVCSKTTQDDGRQQLIRCQATALRELASPLSAGQLAQYRRALTNNRRSLGEIVSFGWYLIRKKLTRQNDSLEGSCKQRTPVTNLGLQIGEKVRVKSLEEIRNTLDEGGCNRGLWFDREEMAMYCGQEMLVTRRIERIVDEMSGKLIELKVPSVALSEESCSGFFRRFCSRGMLFMWRECWLERVD